MRLRKKSLDTVPIDKPVDLGDGEVGRDVPDWATDPLADVMNDELSDVLLRHVNELEPDNRIVFVLRDVHGLSTGDTAEVLGLSVPAVKSRLHRARLYLRQKLSAYFSMGTNNDLGGAAGAAPGAH